MCISSVMAVIDGEIGSAVAMQTALNIGRAFDAPTTLMQVLPPIAPYILDHPDAKKRSIVENFYQNVESAHERQRERFDQLYNKTVTELGIPSLDENSKAPIHAFAATKLLISGHENQEVAQRGRLHDIIVLPPTSEITGGVGNATLETALLDTGRPVLISSRHTQIQTHHNVTIAWDGSRQSTISVRNAMPFLKQAKKVEVAHATCQVALKIPVEDLVRYLHRHGVAATGRDAPKSEHHPGEIIAELASENDNAIIVMGAHGMDNDDDCACGGVAKRVIEHAVSPVFLSH